MSNDDDFIRVGSNVIIDVNGEKFSFIRVRAEGTVKVAGSACNTAPLIGARFGSAFLVDDQKNLIPADENPHEVIAAATWTEKNNAELVAGNSNQQLTHEDVEELKKQSRGADIIKALEEGSATFASKTEFSQEKWLKKKAKKYVHHVTARRPTSSLLCQVHYSTIPLKVFHLRPDTLATLMHAANVGPHSRVLCLDATGGIAAAACVERMGGKGTLCCAHAEASRYSLDYTRLLNVPRWLAASARHCALTSLLEAHERARQAVDKDGEDGTPAVQACKEDVPGAENAAQTGCGAEVQTSAGPHRGEATAPDAKCHRHVDLSADAACVDAIAHHTAVAEAGKLPTVRLRLGDPVPVGVKIPEGVMMAAPEDVDLIAHEGFTSLVSVAPRLEPAELVVAVLDLLLPSASFALFSPSLPPLAECFQKLQSTKHFAALHLQESWWREIQVLPMRTHPTMTTSGTGGYLLTGTRVLPSQRPKDVGDGSWPAGKPPRRKKMRA